MRNDPRLDFQRKVDQHISQQNEVEVGGRERELPIDEIQLSKRDVFSEVLVEEVVGSRASKVGLQHFDWNL